MQKIPQITLQQLTTSIQFIGTLFLKYEWLLLPQKKSKKSSNPYHRKTQAATTRYH
jgi:hypothetical protein